MKLILVQDMYISVLVKLFIFCKFFSFTGGDGDLDPLCKKALEAVRGAY